MAATKNRYEVVAGIHYHHNPDWELSDDGLNRHDPASHFILKQGNVILSEEDLEKKFVGKFRRVVEGQTVVVTEARKRAIAQLISSGVNTEDDRSFLESLTEDGFERLQRMVAPKQMENKVSSILGTDVTSEFQQAYDAGCKVFKTPANKYQVTNKSDMNKPLNTKALDASAVDTFVSSHQKEIK